MLKNSFKLTFSGIAALTAILSYSPLTFAGNNTNITIVSGSDEKLSNEEIQNITSQGIKLADGQEVPQDLVKAFELLSLASAKGNPDAMYRLGMMYFRGEGVEQNQDKANELIAEAATKGNTDALSWMVMMSSDSESGDEVNPDIYKWAKLSAEHGDVRSMVVLANALLKGETPDNQANVKEAISWLTKAKDKGDTEAATELGKIYLEGKFVKADYKIAKECFEFARKEEEAVAIYYLGYMYENGLGVDKDLSKAASYYEESSNYDNADATYSLALLYKDGKGVKQDASRASELFEQACLFGIDDACEKDHDGANSAIENSEDIDGMNPATKLGIQYLKGEDHPKDFRLALKNLEEGSKHKDPAALFYLGLMYEKGLGVAQDYTKAIENYEAADFLDYADATYALALLYKNGQGGTKDEAKAQELLAKACEFGVNEACNEEETSSKDSSAVITKINDNNLESMLETGIQQLNNKSGNHDYQLAFQIFQYASEKDDPVANYYLGQMYEKGLYVKKDYKKAVKQYEKAAAMDNGDALYALGLLYKNGHGVKKDKEHAKELIDDACEFGVTEACKVIW